MPSRPDGVLPGLAWAGIRHHPGRWLLLALGIALAAFLPVVASGLRTEASVAAVQSAVEQLPQPQRAVLAVTSRDLRDQALTQADRSVRAGFLSAGLDSVQQTLTFRPLALGGADVTVGAIDALAADVQLRSGRLPVRCQPKSCEVLAVTLPGSPTTLDAGALGRSTRQLGLVVTGTAELTDQRPVGVRLVPPAAPMLLGGDPAAMSALDSLSLFGRNTAWFGTLDGAAVADQGVARFTRTLAGVADTVNAASGPLSVSWPVEEITSASERGDESAQRFRVLGAGAGALQLGFCLVSAAGMRRRQQLTGRLLLRRGSSTLQVLVVAAVQAVLAVVVGLSIGAGAGVVVIGLRGQSILGQPWQAAARSVGSSWVTLVVLGVAAAVITVAVVRWPATAGRSTQLVTDVVLVAAIGATLLLVGAAGGTPVGSLGGSSSSLAPSVVVLVATATGLLAARLWKPLLSLLSGRSSTSAVREVALIGGRRRPLLAIVTTGFLAASCCSLVFAGAYRGSLMQSAADQAAEQVPLDVRVSPSAQVSVPLDVLDERRILAVSTQVAIHPVVSSAVTAFAGSSLATALPLTGVDPQVLPAVHEFAATTGSDLAPNELANRITVARSTAQLAPLIPAGTSRVALRASGMNNDIVVSLWLSTPQGRQQQVPLTRSGLDLVADLGGTGEDFSTGVGHTLQAVEIAESAAHLVHRQHGVGEGTTDRALAAGNLHLGTLTADGHPVESPWTSWGSDQAQLSGASRESVSVRYQIGDTRVVLTPGFLARTALTKLPVAVDEDTAARAGTAGTFGITINGLTVPAQVVAVLPRMPALGSTFLLADRAAVTALLDRSAPGTAPVTQVWIAAPGASLDQVRAVLASSAATSATLSYRNDLARSISTDPVATRSVALLAIAGGIALLLAIVSVATAVRADLEESAADHFALELDGLPPARLRAVLFARWVSTLLVGIPVGIAGGFVLAAVAVRILVTGPGGAAVVPPIRLVLAAPSTAAVVGAAVLGGLLACTLATATAFRRPLPHAPEIDLR